MTNPKTGTLIRIGLLGCQGEGPELAACGMCLACPGMLEPIGDAVFTRLF